MRRWSRARACSMACEVGVELGRRRERRAVDALQHLRRLVAAQVDARCFEQLDGADLRQPLHVRAAAEVGEAAVAVEGDRLARGDVVEPLDLERLAHLGEEALRLLARHLDALEGAVLAEDLAHLLFDTCEVLGRERAADAEVVLVLLGVVLAAGVVLDVGEEPLHGVGEHVLGTVADEFAGARVLGRHDLDAAAALQRLAQVDEGAVEEGADGVLGRGAARSSGPPRAASSPPRPCAPSRPGGRARGSRRPSPCAHEISGEKQRGASQRRGEADQARGEGRGAW